MSAVPKTERGRQSRARIVEAATELMTQRGVAGVSLEEIQEASGTGKSQLYHYFADKDDLVATVFAVRAEAAAESYRARLGLVRDGDSMSEFLDGVLADSRQAGTAQGCPMASLAAHAELFTGDSGSVIAEGFEAIEVALIEALRRVEEAGDLPAASDTPMLATSVLALIEGGLLLAKHGGNPAALEASLRAARQLLGLRVAPNV